MGTARSLNVNCEDGSVADSALRILTVSTTDIAGGAERIAWNLFDEYRRRGLTSNLAVGYRRLDDPDVFALGNDEQRGAWFKLFSSAFMGIHNAKLKRNSQELDGPVG